MKKAVVFLFLLIVSAQTVSQAGWTDFFSKVVSSSSAPAGLTDSKIAQGLKEALQIGSEKAVSLTGATDGYFKNEAIKILLPEKLRGAETFLRTVGMGPQMDQLILSMNRAAEAAAPQAKSILLKAISGMNFEDVQNIYKGGDTAATQYFQQKTTPELVTLFKPVITKTMGDYNVTKLYQGVTGKYNALPAAKMFPLPSAEDYVTNQSLNGLFKVLGDQEKAIRKDPAARATQLLKDVFSQIK